MAIQDTYGYQKWKQAGELLKGKAADYWIADLITMSPVELRKRKIKAEEWLKENGDHKDYTNLLRRYEHICELIELEEKKEAFL